jgi:hypothetical protein
VIGNRISPAQLPHRRFGMLQWRYEAPITSMAPAASNHDWNPRRVTVASLRLAPGMAVPPGLVLGISMTSDDVQ